jgi:hypothetical protein
MLPIVVGFAIYLPILIAGKMLGWSNDLLGVIEFVVIAFAALSQERVGTWLAPRLGMPPPRRMGERRDAGRNHRSADL